MPWHPTGMPSVCTAARRVAPSPAWRAGLHSAAAARTPPAHLCQHRAKEVSAKAVDACCQLLARDRRGGRPELQRRAGGGGGSGAAAGQIGGGGFPLPRRGVKGPDLQPCNLAGVGTGNCTCSGHSPCPTSSHAMCARAAYLATCESQQGCRAQACPHAAATAGSGERGRCVSDRGVTGEGPSRRV